MIVKIEIEPRLNDGRSGYEGKHYTEYDAALDSADDRWTARLNDGESIEDIKARVANFIRAYILYRPNIKSSIYSQTRSLFTHTREVQWKA